MNILRAHKTKLRPTPAQARYLRGCAGAARYVFNWALADRKATFEGGGKPSKYEQKKRFNAIKDELCPWIREYPYAFIDYEFDHVDAAYQNFFRRIKEGKTGKAAGFPKFKSRHKDRQSFILRDNIHVEHGRIKLPRMGWLNLAEKGYIPAGCDVKSVTVSEQAGNWFVSVLTEAEIPDPQTNGHVIGVDVGVKATAALSDGRTFEAPRTLYQYEKKRARLQRELNRRQKGSGNRAKTKAKIAKMHRKITNVRAHHLHNVSRAVVDTLPAAVVIEDLNVIGMMQNGHLAKAIADAGMSELHRQIAYKAEWSGAELIKAGRFYASSRLCHRCGWYNADLTLSDRVFRCGDCGNETDRDRNAAMNLAAYGERLKRPGLPVELDGLPSTMKQEGGSQCA